MHSHGILAQAAEEDDRAEERKIEALIARSRRSETRCSSETGRPATCDPATAAKFLRGKWKQQARGVRSTREFIEKVATRSSTTGRIDLVRYSDGREVPVATYLHSELRKLQWLSARRTGLPASARRERVTITSMRVASGKVVRGQIIYEGEFPEGADVTLIADDHEVGFEVDPELKAVLLEAIAGCDRGEKISADQLLRELQSDE